MANSLTDLRTIQKEWEEISGSACDTGEACDAGEDLEVEVNDGDTEQDLCEALTLLDECQAFIQAVMDNTSPSGYIMKYILKSGGKLLEEVQTFTVQYKSEEGDL